MANYAFGQTSLDRLATVHPDLQKVAHRALRISMRRHDGGVDFSIPAYGGKRTAEEQNELFKKGVSKADGFEKPSYHQTGLALDVIPYITHEKVKGNAIYTKNISAQKRALCFHIVSVCMLQAASELGVKLSWGGNWRSFDDSPHYQIPRENV
jgi:peptidoglycan L-alanyl-D-glutamate endopeptidase CwlK